MFHKVYEHLSKTENCKILDIKEITNVDCIRFYSEVIHLKSELTLAGSCQEIDFYIAFSKHISIELPKIFLSDEAYILYKNLPHVGNDQMLCIYDNSQNFIYDIEDLPEILEQMIHISKKIISQIDNEEGIIKEIQKEFKAYWEKSYLKNDKTFEIGFSLVDNDVNPIKGVLLNPKIGKYKYLIYNNEALFETFKKYLNEYEIKYSELNLFEIESNFLKPPFNFNFKDSFKYFRESDINCFKKLINKKGLDSVLVIFRNDLGEIYGWQYSNKFNPPMSSLKGYRLPISNWDFLQLQFSRNNFVTRLTFTNLTPHRLQKRTSGIIINNFKSITLIGLGSVGSNLLNNLIKLEINKFILVDNDILRLENINRYQSGLNFLDHNKVDIAKFHILNKKPFCEVLSYPTNIINLLEKEVDLFEKSDVNFIVVGSTLIEKYLLNYLIKNNSKKPIIIIWVEPFLASGQLLYIKNNDFSKAIELITKFPFHIISESNATKTFFKEGSCQSGYYPYSETFLSLFLSALNPKIYQILKNPEIEESKVYTWVGDLEFISELGVEISEFGKSSNSFQLIINEI